MAEERENPAGTVTQQRSAPVATPARDGTTAGATAANGQPPDEGPASPRGGDEGSAGSRRAGFSGRRLRLILIPVIVVVVLIAGYVGGNYYLDNLWYVSTDNAQVTGTPVPVGSVNAGTVEDIPVQVGQSVQKGETLATVVLPITSNSASVRAAVPAPFDSVVIAIPVGVGSTVSPGQGIVVVVDPNTVYVNANIDETDVKRVAPNQPVDVHLDALNTTVPGQVDSITPASAATFSLLPQNNSSGTFTKVTQLVPVKITIDPTAQPLPVGTSAEVKIHVVPGH